MKLNEIKRDIIRECYEWLVEFNSKQKVIPHYDSKRFKSEFDDYFNVYNGEVTLNIPGTAFNIDFTGAWRNPPFNANVYNLGLFDSDCQDIDLTFLKYSRSTQFHHCKVGDTQNLIKQKSKLEGVYLYVDPSPDAIRGIVNLIDNIPGALIALRNTPYHISNRKHHIEILTGSVAQPVDSVFELQEWLIDNGFGDIA